MIAGICAYTSVAFTIVITVIARESCTWDSYAFAVVTVLFIAVAVFVSRAFCSNPKTSILEALHTLRTE